MVEAQEKARSEEAVSHPDHPGSAPSQDAALAGFVPDGVLPGFFPDTFGRLAPDCKLVVIYGFTPDVVAQHQHLVEPVTNVAVDGPPWLARIGRQSNPKPRSGLFVFGYGGRLDSEESLHPLPDALGPFFLGNAIEMLGEVDQTKSGPGRFIDHGPAIVFDHNFMSIQLVFDKSQQLLMIENGRFGHVVVLPAVEHRDKGCVGGGYRWVMDRSGVEAAFDLVEQRLTGSGKVDLSGTGFWKAVAAVKGRPEWIDEYAERIGRIEREVFQRWALVKVPVAVGTTVMVLATALGFFLIGRAYSETGLAQAFLLGAGTGTLMVSTHGLTHLVVGTLQGMRFTHWFVGTASRPQPGVKLDYASYIRIPASKRAWMHASGAITTKLIPLVGLGAGWAMDAESWALALLALVAVGQVVIDVVWSTKKSDWKKFRREMAYASPR